ncbi:hypothetical protein OESDEN_24743 [Oesophagostomum dentatum]|uniref:NPHP4 Ig-like domain-containing protein n=1 Tax=Oesophagostomum dentatum TaxID=61180 RepID=A0A0B1RVJ7_OESDE|nr:hypothetical protein OESDEN_24743 [Oesophagostomum dentatum]
MFRLDIQQRYEEIFDEQSYDRIRQWEKLKHGVVPAHQKGTVKKFLFEEELEAYRQLRNQSKASKLLEAVFQGITSRYYIFPSLGEKAFFEYLLQNTYPEPVNCIIDLDEPGLSIVTDLDEWAFYKRANSRRNTNGEEFGAKKWWAYGNLPEAHGSCLCAFPIR